MYLDKNGGGDGLNFSLKGKRKDTHKEADADNQSVTCVFDWQCFSRQNNQQSLNTISWDRIRPIPQCGKKNKTKMIISAFDASGIVNL